MLFSSLILLLIAAGLHAITNALMKQARDKLAFIWWMLGVFCVFGSPILFFVPSTDPTAWSYVVASGLLESIYFLTLSKAYTHGDLSLVYPVARGSAPLFIVIWASLFLSERPTVLGYLGIVCIVSGLYMVHLPSISHWRQPLPGLKNPAVRWASLTGVLISAYTTVDKKGVSYFPPYIYLYLILSVCWISLTPLWFSRAKRKALLQEVSNEVESQKNASGQKRRILLFCAAALFGTIAYTLVLMAMRLSPVSYVGPVREVSVIIGAWIGVRFMSEHGGALRIAASSLVALGIVLIAVGG